MKLITMAATMTAVLVTAACSTESARTADTTVTVAATPSMADTAMMPSPMPSAGMMNPNSASASDLAGVAGINAALASAVVGARPYTNMVGVDKILAKSLTRQQRDSVYAHLWIPIDLNKASNEEILLIPGVGAKMLHEFEEYRPWKSVEQFRREIGKYVDAAEVARLEKYITL
ncbi:MAG: hypothetical protein ABIS03_11820 [Gemmatimonadaceae bacterium]